MKMSESSFRKNNNNNNNNSNNRRTTSLDAALDPDSAPIPTQFRMRTPSSVNTTIKTTSNLNINDFIKNNYGAIIQQQQQQPKQQQQEREGEQLLLGGDNKHNPINNYNHNSNHNHNNNSSNSNNLYPNNNYLNNTIYYPDKNDGSVHTEDSHSHSLSTTTTKLQPKWTLRKLALELSLWSNVFITVTKLVAYCQTLSLSVLAALLDSLLDVVSQLVLNYTEQHSSLQRSSALYPAGASRLEPIGVLTCASLMGMASFEVLKESFETLVTGDSSLKTIGLREGLRSALSMAAIVVLKLLLLWLCNAASSNTKQKRNKRHKAKQQPQHQQNQQNQQQQFLGDTASITSDSTNATPVTAFAPTILQNTTTTTQSRSLQLVAQSDPTLEAVAQDHRNDALSNGVSAVALLLALDHHQLWWCDPVGAIVISIYIIRSWYHTGKEQIEHLTGKSAPADFLEELTDLAEHFDERLLVDTCRAYHFGPKFLVELEVVMPMDTLLKESHDLGMELQYEIEAREEVERCFVHIDYESRDYDEHVVSKVPELREHLLRHRSQSAARAFCNSAMSV
jgi:cation diffusion facilitator family transporter